MTLFAKLAAESMVADNEDGADEQPKKRNWGHILAAAGLAGALGYGGYQLLNHKADVTDWVNSKMGNPKPGTNHALAAAETGAGAGLVAPLLTNRTLGASNGRFGSKVNDINDLVQTAGKTKEQDPRAEHLNALADANVAKFKSTFDTRDAAIRSEIASRLRDPSKEQIESNFRDWTTNPHRFPEDVAKKLNIDLKVDPAEFPKQFSNAYAPTRESTLAGIQAAAGKDAQGPLADLYRAATPATTWHGKLADRLGFQPPGSTQPLDRFNAALKGAPNAPLDPKAHMYLSGPELGVHTQRFTAPVPRSFGAHVARGLGRAGIGAGLGLAVNGIADSLTPGEPK